MCIFLVRRILFIYRKNSAKKDNENNIKQYETKENYVQRTTIYNSHIGNQQINSSDTAYLLMCYAANTVNRSFVNYFTLFLIVMLHSINCSV